MARVVRRPTAKAPGTLAHGLELLALPRRLPTIADRDSPNQSRAGASSPRVCKHPARTEWVALGRIFKRRWHRDV